MKQLTFTLTALCLCTLMLVSCSDKKKKLKAEITKECIDGGEKQFSDPKMRGYFHEYCECSGDKIVDKVGYDEFQSMKGKGEAEMQAKLMPIIQPCLNELQQKMTKGTK